jgi:hypothetical protein
MGIVVPPWQHFPAQKACKDRERTYVLYLYNHACAHLTLFVSHACAHLTLFVCILVPLWQHFPAQKACQDREKNNARLTYLVYL